MIMFLCTVLQIGKWSIIIKSNTFFTRFICHVNSFHTTITSIELKYMVDFYKVILKSKNMRVSKICNVIAI